MPPKPKITREMIVDAAFEIARAQGAETINARTVAGKLNCSTQPVMYHFSKIEDIKRAVYEKADKFHSEYISNIGGNTGEPMLAIGLQYIRFAAEEKYLFRFLFQSGEFAGKTLAELVEAGELEPVLSVMQESVKTNREQAKKIFVSIFLLSHGYASMLANNAMKYDETFIVSILKSAYVGAICASNKERL